ncbi:hypothetical protein [Corynebacterium sp.]|uniref:hypothetical protein n=1 Tax=Corynebacterium sp. TaxID=1720 RepID=UPI00261C88AB|nr:hypothetical protein [Corynebacterium sp.]
MKEHPSAQRHGSWIESIAVAELLYDGNHAAAKDLIDSSAFPDEVVGDVLRLFSLFLRLQSGAHPEEVSSFFEASISVGPPPTFGSHPRLP